MKAMLLMSEYRIATFMTLFTRLPGTCIRCIGMQIEQLAGVMGIPVVLHQRRRPWPGLGMALGDGRVIWMENDSAHAHLSTKLLRPAVFSPRLDHRGVRHIFPSHAGDGRVWELGR